MAEKTLAGKDNLISMNLLSDQRGAVAFEMLIVFLFMMMGLLLPLADLAIAGFKFISAWQALRDIRALAYHPPPDVTIASGWQSYATHYRCGLSGQQPKSLRRCEMPALQATVFRPSTIHTRRPLPCRRWC